MVCFSFNKKRNKKGFTLIETLIGVTIFAIIALSAWLGFVKILDAVQVLRVKTAATNLATEQIEIIRNLSYGDVGVQNSIPDGVVPHEQFLERDGHEFRVVTTIRNIDLEFDGTIGGDPNDLSPADNKLVQIDITCNDCPRSVATVSYTTHVAPLALESTGDNGALFVNVIDSTGQPITGADVHVENNQTTTPIIIDDVTNTDGILQLVDVPPGTEAYEITVTKLGFSTERTYAIGDPENPVPDKPHSNVASGLVTEITFSIDELSELNLYTRSLTCSSLSDIDFNLTGSKTIGQNLFKYNQNHATDGSGWQNLGAMEWDTYTFTLLEAGKDLIGANPNIPFDVNPGTTHSVDLILGNSDPNSVLVTVIDGSNEQLLSDATVLLEQGTASTSAVTGSGYLEQIDWSGSSGQENFIDETRYYAQDGDIETNNPAGELKLAEFSGSYVTSGWLESSTFDIGTTTNFLNFNWGPVDQPQEVGLDPIRFQIATNETLDQPLLWDYKGPTGSGSTYYTTSGQAIHSSHDGHRYLRYRVFMDTEDDAYTPNVSDIRFTFASDCTPVGQVYFSGLNGSAYDVTISKTGYESITIEDVAFDQDWQALNVTLNPE